MNPSPYQDSSYTRSNYSAPDSYNQQGSTYSYGGESTGYPPYQDSLQATGVCVL